MPRSFMETRFPPGPSSTLAERARAALDDRFLQQALETATTRFQVLRREAYRDFPEGDFLRERGRQIKEAVLQRMDYYLELLADNVEKAGGVVHWAADASEAREIVVALARQRGVRLVVKSKSMVTEEIDLNEALEAAGITPVETDLGEYIIQLAHERPSHIIAPAIHKTRGQVADLFSKKLGRPLAADPEVLTAAARQELREKFFEAAMGISGANFAVAETGTIVLITNEGNGRLVTTLPRIHVAVMGMEKVIPSLTDLMVFLQILPRSATGQKLSSYTTMIRGPRRAAEVDGAEEFHLVILDGGRSAQLAGRFREALYCLRCGACLNVCPVYRQIGGHAYGGTYAGPIGILAAAMLRGTGAAKELAHASSLCGACQEACPVKIDIPRMLIELRQGLDEDRIAPWGERVMFRLFARLLVRPSLFRLAGRLGRVVQRPFLRGGRLRSLPLVLKAWTDYRDLSPLAPRSFRERWDEMRGRG